MIGFLTPLADSGISYAFGFVFVGTNIAAAALVWFFLYESRTLSLEHVDLMYGQKDLNAWNSHRWVPPGYVSREKRDEHHFSYTNKKVGAGIDGISEVRTEHA